MHNNRVTTIIDIPQELATVILRRNKTTAKKKKRKAHKVERLARAKGRK